MKHIVVSESSIRIFDLTKTVRNYKVFLSGKIPIKQMQGDLYLKPEDWGVLDEEFSNDSLRQSNSIHLGRSKIGQK